MCGWTFLINSCLAWQLLYLGEFEAAEAMVGRVRPMATRNSLPHQADLCNTVRNLARRRVKL